MKLLKRLVVLFTAWSFNLYCYAFVLPAGGTYAVPSFSTLTGSAQAMAGSAAGVAMRTPLAMEFGGAAFTVGVTQTATRTALAAALATGLTTGVLTVAALGVGYYAINKMLQNSGVVKNGNSFALDPKTTQPVKKGSLCSLAASTACIEYTQRVAECTNAYSGSYRYPDICTPVMNANPDGTTQVTIGTNGQYYSSDTYGPRTISVCVNGTFPDGSCMAPLTQTQPLTTDPAVVAQTQAAIAAALDAAPAWPPNTPPLTPGSAPLVSKSDPSSPPSVAEVAQELAGSPVASKVALDAQNSLDCPPSVTGAPYQSTSTGAAGTVTQTVSQTVPVTCSGGLVALGQPTISTTKQTTSVDGKTNTETTTQNGQADPSTDPCTGHSTRGDCADLGTPPGDSLPSPKSIDWSVTPVQLSTVASCPQDMALSFMGRSASITFSGVCSVVQGYLAPLTLLLAGVAAIRVVVGGFKT